MDFYGCAGSWGHGGTQKLGKHITKNEPADHNFDAMAGEISPDMML